MSKIGVFDSGYGGLSILRALRKELSEYDYLYLGDNARAPYGVLEPDQVYENCQESVEYLFRHGAEIVVFACNTASAVALRKLQQEYLPIYYPNRRILGVLIPAAEEVALQGYKRVGVMATATTVESRVFTAEIKKLSPETEIIEQPCPLLVPLIERHQTSGKEIEAVVREYLRPLEEAEVEAIILGCTHYELIADLIKGELTADIAVISEGRIVSMKLREYFHRHPEIENRLTKGGQVELYTTDNAYFKDGVTLFYGNDATSVEVDLHKRGSIPRKTQ